jgi:fluoroacetyl-CoA thioesterase
LTEIAPGLKGHASLVVGTNDTAPYVGSGWIYVLATPVMLKLMEEAALNAVERLLPENKQSLGTRVDITHIAATPIGMKVSASAELIDVSGRKLTFKLSAHDEVELIGEGTHERVIVSAGSFQKRINEKLKI